MNALIAIDIQNLYHKFAEKSQKIDFGKLKQRIIDDVIESENDKLEFLAFFSIHHRGIGEGFEAMLKHYGYTTFPKKTYDGNKNVDVILVSEILARLIFDSPFDIFVLVAGDRDYGKLIDIMRYKGKQTVIYSLRTLLSKQFLNSANKIFILEEKDIILK